MILSDLEDTFFGLWIALNHTVNRLESGTDAAALVPLLREELKHGLEHFVAWKMAKWEKPSM